MAIAITGDLDWVGDLILYLEALDGGPAADVAGYAFTSSGDIEYSCSMSEPVDPDDRLLGLYRCVAKTAGGVIAGVGYVTIVADATSVSIRSERASVLNTETQTQLDDIETSVNANTGYLTALTSAVSALAAKVRKYFQLSLRKDAAIATDNAAELAELNASGGSGAGSYLSTTDSQEAIRDSIAGVISSAIASAGVATTVTGIPTFLRVGDARTVANGGAIAVRLYDADDDSLLFGLGTKVFEDATITFSLRRGGNDGTEGTEDAVIPCTWVASGGDGYVRIAYEGDALDGCDAMDKLKEKDCHRWGIKFQWGDDDPITPVYGTVSVLRKIVSTQ